MNYIKELNLFWKFIETNQLDGYTILLYYAILHLRNNSGWAKTITISNKRLEAIMGISEKTLIKHRNILIEVGLLIYSSRQRVKKSGKYTLLSFQHGEVEKIKSTGETAVLITADSKAELDIAEKNTAVYAAQYSADCSDLYKQNETKCIINIDQKSNKELNLLLDICNQNNINVGCDDINQNWLLELIEKYDTTWIEKAITVASKKNKISKQYIQGILANWKTAGKVTMFSNGEENFKKEISFRRTRFHNFNQRSEKYTAEELENIVSRKRQDYLNKLKADKDESGKDGFTILN